MALEQIAREGIWSNNPALVQLLGLCPLLAVSGTLVNSIALGMTTLVVLTLSNLVISLLRGFLDDSTRLPAQIMVIAGFVTLADLTLQTWFFDVHERIGLFVALIVTNCALLARAEAFASRNGVGYAVFDGLMMGTGFLLAIVAMGTFREVLGQGTLFANMHLVFGEQARGMQVTIAEGGWLLMVLPPGAFLTLGFLIALKNRIELSMGERG